MNYLIYAMAMFFGSEIVLFDFTKDYERGAWYVLNDGVMGGLSEGEVSITEKGTGLFTGTVSLENNGGFTSIRHRFEAKKVKGKTKALLRLKGDGKRYQFRTKTDVNDWHSYIYHFETSGEWETIEIPLAEMYPSFRGRQLNRPNFPANSLEEISILISNKTAENFRLEIDKISLR